VNDEQRRFGASAGFRRFLIAVSALGLLVAATSSVVLTLQARSDRPVRDIQFASLSDPNVVFLQAVDDPALDPFTSPVAADLGYDTALFVIPPQNASAVESSHHRASQADMLAAGAFAQRLVAARDAGDRVTIELIESVAEATLGEDAAISGLEDRNRDGRDDDGRFTLTAADGSAACVSLGDPRAVPLSLGLAVDPADGTAVSGYQWDPFGPCGGRVPPQTGQEVKNGTTAGVFGGSANGEVCDVEALADRLAAVPIVGEAWAAVHGITVEELPAFVLSQTPVLLLSDTTATDYGLRNGQIVPRLAILERGTAVLVDDRGTLTARCISGSPLRNARPIPADAEFSGEPWQGFSPRFVDDLRPGEVPVDEFLLVDVRSGDLIVREPGTAGASDTMAGPTFPRFTG
jgi:hypothetical protein